MNIRMHWLRGGVVLAALGFVGCGGGSEPPPPEASDQPRLAESIDVNIADWLDKPRVELAEKCEDKTKFLHDHLIADRSTKDTAELLPDLKPAVTTPVFRTAAFSKARGVSVPPYLADDGNDREIAWHLARFGDVDAAKKVAGPADPDFLAKLEQMRCGRNYPVEWTRLVAMELYDAEMRLARKELDGADELVHIHRQLNKVLDAKAKAGPLGAALLPAGRRALALAAPALRQAPFNHGPLADDIEAALGEWKDLPTPQLGLAVGADKKDVGRIFRRSPQGRIFAASTNNDILRVLDLASLPIPGEDVDGVVAFLDGQGRLSEILAHYHGNTRQNFPRPSNLAQRLVDCGGDETQLAELPGVLRQTFRAGGHAYQVSVFKDVSSGSAATSAIVRVGGANGSLAEPALPASPRDLGAVNLDRSFDQNRLSLDATLKPGAGFLETSRESAITRIQQPARDPRPVNVALTREGETDLLASVAVRWTPGVNKEAMTRLALPMWAAYGGSRIEGVEDSKGGHIAFIWENDTTSYTLRLPFAEVNPPEFVAADRRTGSAAAKRLETVAAFDQAQRDARIKAGNPLRRLDRWLYERDVFLGMSKSDALLRLPKSQKKYRQTNTADGVSLLFLESPDQAAPYSPRQMWVRFGPGDRVAEIRVRYVEGPAKPSKEKPALFDWLRREPQGEPEAQPSAWANLWNDLPKKGTPVRYCWRDDVTVLTYERDAGGSEVTLRDRPLDQPDGVRLPPLQYCARGVENCHLGDARADVLKHWPEKETQTAPDGGLMLSQPKTSTYDLLVVWFDNDKVSRVVARHRSAGATYNDVPRLLQEVWSRDVDTLGVIRRQDLPSGQLLQGYGWHDDKTRVRIFGQDSEEGPRLMTEWRDWPLSAK
jgi:hypothetical protein